jgi:hypothetical protein
VHAHVDKLVSVVKMATVLQIVLPKNSISLCFSGGGKRTRWKDIHKEIFPVNVGKYLSRKGVYNWV